MQPYFHEKLYFQKIFCLFSLISRAISSTLLDIPGSFGFVFGTQNEKEGSLDSYPVLNLTGITHSGGTHAILVLMEDETAEAQRESAKAKIDKLITNNPGLPKKGILHPGLQEYPAPEVGNVTVEAGTAPVSTQVSAGDTPEGHDQWNVEVTTTEEDVPAAGETAPVSGFVDYTLGGNIKSNDVTGDVVVGSYIQLYSVDSEGNVIAFYQQLLEANGNDVRAPMLGGVGLPEPGTSYGSTKYETADEPEGHASYYVDMEPQGFYPQPIVGQDAPTGGIDNYSLGDDIVSEDVSASVESSFSRTLVIYSIDNDGKILAATGHMFLGSNYHAVYEISGVSVGPGDVLGTTKVEHAIQPDNHHQWIVDVKDTEQDIPGNGTEAPTDGLTGHMIGTDIASANVTGTVEEDAWLVLYSVDDDGDVLEFFQQELQAEDINND